MDLLKKLNMLTGLDQDSDRDLSFSAISKQDDLVEAPDHDESSISLDDLSISHYIDFDEKEDKKAKKKKKHTEIFDDFEDDDYHPTQPSGNKKLTKIQSSKIYQKITKKMSSDTISDFESFLNDDGNFEDAESEELKNNLISIGRKYARDTGVDAASSEIVKVYSDSDSKLKDLYTEVTRDSQAIQTDIDQMRALTRGKNFKTLSDLAAAKNSAHLARLSIIKERDAITKAQFEMRMKEQAQKNATGDSSTDISSNTIKSLFGGGSLVNAIGGYSRVSGAHSDANTIDGVMVDGDVDDDTIEQKYFSDSPELTDEEREGEQFLKYENDGVEYILLVDDDKKPMDLIAEDKNGNTIPDYPMPNNFRNLQFNIDMQTGTASDELHRQYKVREI